MQTITIAPPKRSWFSLLSWAVVLAVLVVSWQGAEMAPLTLIKDGGNMATFAADFFPPDFSQWQDYLTEMAVTLQIAVWGTALAVVLSIPFGLMSAENLVPWWVYQPVRRLMDACRAQAKECQRLEIPNMSPLLCVRTLNHRDGESSPAEYSVSLTRADMIEFTMEH